MWLRALALDYDGTVAHDGVLAPEVRTAIGRARASGLTVLLVTGRILGDLRRVAGDLSFVDAIVAENGAVVAFPKSGRSSALHIPPSRAFLDELGRRGVKYETGDTVIEADASAASAALDAIRKHEQPLSLLFNRGRMMILPQSVSKATGLAAVLNALRLSPHNVLAIGDAENDHELLRAAEIGVAVEWGSPALKQAADDILTGRGPADVGPYIDSLIARCSDSCRGLQIRHPRRHTVLGRSIEGKDVSLAVTGRNLLICGDPRSGKSWVAGLLCEQLILHGYSVCVIDPEGDYASLEALPRVTVVGGDDPPPKPHELLRLLRRPDGSLVLDLSHLSHAEKCEYLSETLPQICRFRRQYGLPHRMLIDEAHYWLHGEDAASLVDVESGGFTIVTYLASRLAPSLVRASEIVLVTRAIEPDEIAALATLSGQSDSKEWRQVLGSLAADEVALLPTPGAAEAGGRLLRIRLVERLTPHIRHRMKYLDVPVAERHAFVFTEWDRPLGENARTLKEFIDHLGRTAAERLHGHVQRGDFSKWIGEVFGDRSLASTIRRLEDNYRLGQIPDINDAIAQAVRARYEFPEGEG